METPGTHMYRTTTVHLDKPHMPVIAHPRLRGFSLLPKDSVIFTGRRNERCADEQATGSVYDKPTWFAPKSKALGYAQGRHEFLLPCVAVKDMVLFDLYNRDNVEELLRREQDPDVRHAILYCTGIGECAPEPGVEWERPFIHDTPFEERCTVDVLGQKVCATHGWTDYPIETPMYTRASEDEEWTLVNKTLNGYAPVHVRTSYVLGSHVVGYEHGRFMRATGTDPDGLVVKSIAKHFKGVDGYYAAPTITLRNQYSRLQMHEEICLPSTVDRLRIDCARQAGGGLSQPVAQAQEWPSIFR